MNAQGAPTLTSVTRNEVQETFDVYNALYFAGRLSRPKFRLQKMVRYLALFHWPCPEHPAGLIILNKVSPHPSGWQGTLLHEMIHAWLSEHAVNDDHGPEFTAECNRIGRALGLRDVDVSESWKWPHHHVDAEEWGEVNILD